jgi:hypothetical protein
MIITRHRYRVKPEYVAQNRQNLDEFIAALTAASVPGLSYRVFLEEDGQTFLHLVTSRDDPSAVITGLPSFQEVSIGTAGERTPPKTRSGRHVARGDERRFVWVGAWPVTDSSLLTGDLLRCPDTLSSVHSRRDEIHVQ